MGKIFVIVGKSGSGKDTIFNILKESELLDPIITYTTRPMRSGEVEGKEYHFVNSIQETSKLIELRIYNTINGIWKYATIDDGSINLENKNYITINTLYGLDSLQKYFGKDNIVPIYIYVNTDDLFERVVSREQSLENPNYYELCRRFVADSNDFKKLPDCINNINTFENDDLEKCADKIIKYIKGVINE